MIVISCSLAPHTSLLMLFIGPVVHLHGLTSSRKAICESRLEYLHIYGYPCAWCVWTVLECTVALMLSHKLDFNGGCANKNSFHKSSHIFVNTFLRMRK